MPLDCPTCQRPLYPTARLRPQPRTGTAGRVLYVAGGLVAAAVTLSLAAYLRERWSHRMPIAGTEFDLIIYPPAKAVVLPSLPIGLLPGVLLGYLAHRLPRFRRLRCRGCGWRKDYPVDALWEAAEGTAKAANPQYLTDLVKPAMPAIADDPPDAWKEACAWAWAELRGGRTPEEAEAELVAQGWPRDEVEVMVERTRKAVRGRA